MAEKPKAPQQMSIIEKTWRKEIWTCSDFYTVVMGVRVKERNRHTYEDTHDEVYSSNGEKLSSKMRENSLELYYDIKEVFLAANHGPSDYDEKFNQHPSDPDFQATRGWFVRWALAYNDNFITEGFTHAYDEARESGWIVGETPQIDTEPNTKEMENRLRLIGVLAEMLQDKNVSKEDTKNAASIAKYIADNYGTDMPMKGLAEDTVVKALTAAKKRLKEDGIK